MSSQEEDDGREAVVKADGQSTNGVNLHRLPSSISSFVPLLFGPRHGVQKYQVTDKHQKPPCLLLHYHSSQNGNRSHHPDAPQPLRPRHKRIVRSPPPPFHLINTKPYPHTPQLGLPLRNRTHQPLREPIRRRHRLVRRLGRPRKDCRVPRRACDRR